MVPYYLTMTLPSLLVFSFVFYIVFDQRESLRATGAMLLGIGITMEVKYLRLIFGSENREYVAREVDNDLHALMLIVFILTILPGLLMVGKSRINNGRGSEK